MAVTLTQLSKDVARQRARTVPSRTYNPSEIMSSNMRPYNSNDVVPMPMPEQYHHRSQPTRNYDHGPYGFFRPQTSTYPPHTSQQSHMDPSYQISIPSAVEPISSYYDSPSAFNQYPQPQATRASSRDSPSSPSSPSSPRGSEHSSTSFTGSSYSRSSIEPDPLPPHSNPQALTESQSQAYANSQRIPALRVGKDEVWNSQTGFAEFRIAREDGKIRPSFMSTKPRLSVIKTENGIAMGYIRFHALSSNKIALTINGRETSLSHTGFVHNRWGFQSTTCPNQNENWYWKKDKQTGGAMLEDAKRSGHVLAKMKGDLLTFEKARLNQESYEEIVLSAVAMAEAARRQKRKSDIVDIAAAVGDFASSDGKYVAGGAGGSWG